MSETALVRAADRPVRRDLRYAMAAIRCCEVRCCASCADCRDARAVVDEANGRIARACAAQAARRAGEEL
jgi:hypothetical protein